MPIYEYLCSKCGTFEITQRITEKPLGKCPTCKGKVKKLISNTSFQLKGTGWYITDYARKGNGETKADKPASESKSEPKSEPKGESKKESKSTDNSAKTGTDKPATTSSSAAS
jgi:putative FmdB family regulatory protein